MENTVKQRLIDYLAFKKIGQNRFEKMAGVSNGYIHNLKNAPKTPILTKILQAAPDLNRVWLLTGEGDMLLRHDEASVVTHERPRVGIPLVSQYAYGGYLGGYADPTYIEGLPLIDFTPDREMTGNWLAFEVRGDSMDDGTKDSYVAGEIVICREVEKEFWRDARLHYTRRDFVIVHEEGILIKRVTAHDVERHLITVHSLNPEYKDRVLDLADVRQLFSVVESRIPRLR